MIRNHNAVSWIYSRYVVCISILTSSKSILNFTARTFKQRARENVWLEAGWFWGRLGRENLLALSRGEIEFPSDLTGLEVYGYQENPTERAEKLRAYLGSE